MTQQEFTDRTGLTPTEMEFQYVHDIYMQTNLNKDMFCRDYKKHGKSEIVEELYGKLEAKNRAFDELFTRHDNFKNEKYKQELELARFLFSKAATYNDVDFEHEALKLVSRNTAILIKIKEGYQLTDDDFAYIANNLK